MKRRTFLATAATALTGAFAAAPLPAQAAAASASISGSTATLNLDGADDNETVSVAGGLLVHTSTGGGLNSSSDWDSSTAGDQTVPANGTFTVVINGGDGQDAITVLAKTTEIAKTTLNGDGGDDVLTGADTADTLNGGDGNDRLIGAKGADTMNGGAGNDTLVWNNGDASDVANGDAGNDATEVNGSPTAGDAFLLEPNGGRIKFARTDLVPFTIDASTERFEVNGLGGSDRISAVDGVGALTLLSVDGGAGNDEIFGSDGPDLLRGGEGDDMINGDGGDDRIVGDRGSDTMNGGAGDDTLVWNNGDGTDVVNGDDGDDDVEVNGAPAAGDAFTVAPIGARVRFDRTNLVPFSIDIGSSESLHANGLGGDDTIAIGDVGGFSVTASGGSGNDTLTGGPGSDTLLGGSGDDTIVGGAGLDVVSGGTGDDHVDVRDGGADVAFGGDGTDSVVADKGRRDVLDGFESVDRPPFVPPPPGPKTLPVGIDGRTVKVVTTTAPFILSCPAASSAACAGTLEIRTAQSVRFGAGKAVATLGRARFSIAPGTTMAVPVTLVYGVRQLADRKARLKVVAAATVVGPAGATASSSRHVTLAFAGSKRV